MIDVERRICYVKVPKTAGTSVLMALLDPYGLTLDDGLGPPVVNLNRVDGFRISPEFRMPRRTKRYNGWHVAARDQRRWLGDEWNEYRSFAVVRDPFDRIVSNYEWQRGKGRAVGSFDRFVDCVATDADGLHRQARLHSISQSAWVCSQDGELLVDTIVHFESLPREFAEFAVGIGVDPSPIERLNVTERRPVAEYYSSASTTQTVLDLYRSDFERFGYANLPG